MNISQSENFYKKSGFILFLILSVFFFKGVFLAILRPIFVGQDEARHYNSIQYLTEPAKKDWEIIQKQMEEKDRDNFETYNFSEEIKNTATLTNNNLLRSSISNTIIFSKDYIGKNENEINQNNLPPINKFYPPDIVNGSLYHKTASFIEKILENQNIFFRYYTIRIFSVFLGTLAILFAYLIAKNMGFSEKNSLLLTTIISFHPKLSEYFSNINYDVLMIPMFFLFTLGGILALKNGLGWKNLAIMFFAALIGFKAKGSGIVLFGILALLFLYFINEKIKAKEKKFRYAFYAFFAIALVLLFAYFKKFMPFEDRSILQTFSSLFKYLGATMTVGRFLASANTYWGALSWTNSFFLDKVTYLIWLIQFFAFAGLGLFFFSKKEKPAYLPEKKYIVFLLIIIFALQIGIRSFDWRIFSKCDCFALGLPGRYFLPNLASHIILVFVGLGMLFHYFKKQHYFDTALKTGLIFMFSITTYLIFNVIMYRFYL
ncbi:MAG: hypothetical protein ACD_11C00018G0012 [uncultured bacterium]|nr:MAG: hypothetical protein ACD_11C00018G0012 [uncultured bacterium]HBR71538.1 hypothetical protein [Candidatus Moranbacteria bacterium]